MSTPETLIDFNYWRIKMLEERIKELETQLENEKLKNIKHN